MQNRIGSGLLLFDEPESALSPQRQLALLAQMSILVATGKSQFIIATHSPILLTFPGAQILAFDGNAIQQVCLEDTSHYQITKGILQNPAVYWKHLQETAAGREQPIPTQTGKSKDPRARRSNASEG
jgi:predicted ATPase